MDMKKLIFIFFLLFSIGCASQHQIGGDKVDKYIKLAETNLKNGDLDFASENLRNALDSNPDYEQTKEINVLLDKIVDEKNKLEKTTKLTPKTKEEKKEPEIKKKSETTTVYITRTGKKYHRSWCSYLKKSSIPISLKDAKARGYTPCSKCNPPR